MAQIDFADPLSADPHSVDPLSADLDDAPRLGRKRDHTRDPAILDATLDVLAEAGYDGMTVDMVAARAKAGKATLYRRWPSKSELVLDALACMKRVETDPDKLPNTGTLRGDLIAMIKAPSIEDAEKKLKIMGGLVSLLSRHPELAEAANAAMLEPRSNVTRFLINRAAERGEIAPGYDIDTLVLVSPSMAAHRVLIQRKPVNREFLISIIDGIILPALGIQPSRSA
jgi:AcrR family transcriptional regulator